MVNSPITWFGGKHYLVPFLKQFLVPHTLYVEPYGGGGSVLFAKAPSKLEVYNDIDSDVVNFFRVLRDRGDEFMAYVYLMPHSREEHKASLRSFGDSDLERAARFFMLCRQSISGNLGTSGWRFVIKADKLAWVSTIDKLPEVINRLRHVQIEHDDALNVIRRYDAPDTLFYLDPPYMHDTRGTARYRYEMSDQGHTDLLNLILTLEGMVFISGYNNPLYNTMLSSWNKKSIDIVCRAAATTQNRKGVGSLQDQKYVRTEVVWYNDALKHKQAQLELF